MTLQLLAHLFTLGLVDFSVLAQAAGNGGAAAAGAGAGIGIVFLLIIAITSIFWLWMLIDCIVNPAITGTEKIVWILVILFLHVLGAAIYFFVGRKKGPAAI